MQNWKPTFGCLFSERKIGGGGGGSGAEGCERKGDCPKDKSEQPSVVYLEENLVQ